MKMNEKAKEYYLIIHAQDLLKVLNQIKVSAEVMPDELNSMDQEDYDSLIKLLTKYYVSVQTIKLEKNQNATPA